MHSGIRDLLERAHAARAGLHLNQVVTFSYDPWCGIAHDLIDRFIEIQRVAKRLEPSTMEACRGDLRRLDDWMMRERGGTLMTAQAVDLRRYVDTYIENSTSIRAVFRALWHMWSFYRFLLEAGCRSDDPLELILSAPRDHVRPDCRRVPEPQPRSIEVRRCSLQRVRRGQK